MNEKITQMVGKVKLGAKRNAPELLLATALVTGTACIVTASRATVKASKLNKVMDEEKTLLDIKLNDGLLIAEDAKDEVKKLYIKYALDLCKTYAIPVGLYAATVASVFGSYKIQKNRQIALSAALAACTTAYTTLYNKLATGAAAGLTAKEVMDGMEAREVIDPDTGEVTYDVVQGKAVSDIYTNRFDRYSTAWSKDKFQNESTLRGEECWANDRLRLQGYLFLNDVYNRLGLQPTREGQIVGWLFDGEGDGFVDFGIVDCDTLDGAKWDDNAFELNFNIDGDILNKFKDVEVF